MPSGAADGNETAEPALLLLQQRLQGLGFATEEEEEEEDDDGGEAELREAEDDEAALLLLPRALDVARGRAMMAEAVLAQAYGHGGAGGGEQAALLRRRSVNSTECVAVPSSEHVAEIVGRQGCKIKASLGQDQHALHQERPGLGGEEPGVDEWRAGEEGGLDPALRIP
ncbi:RNA-binding E3 ubiquitin-protein ligase MEX3C-like, partial [Camarhynchus parvulus]|uniref:RNA-binding E3 ubiquitin-protein ligase MEX3C-like n=1 Tax=Geospiza parvula TaxID=87175 RepID=UPI001237E45B